MTTTAQEKNLIFSNLLNGNTPETLEKAFNKSKEDVDGVFKFVIGKIKSYMFTNALPYVKLDTVDEARKNRLFIFDILERLNLDTAAAYSRIVSQPIDDYVKKHL